LKGVILAAGLGTRMRPLTHRRPKPLVPVLDRPMIEHIVRGAIDAGVAELLIVVGYRGHMIREALGSGDRFGLTISYQVQETPAGTGDAALLAEDFVGGEPFFLSWGDIIVSRRNYARLRQVWTDESPDLLLTVNEVADPYEGAAVYVEDGRVVRIIEKPPKGTSTTNYNNAGIFILPPEVLSITRSVPQSPRGERELPDAIQALLSDGAHVRAMPIDGCWSDVARPAQVIRLNAALLGEAEYPGDAIEAASVARGQDVASEPPYVVGEDTRLGAGSRIGPAAYVLEGGAIGERCCVTNSLILPGATVGDGCELDWVIVEEGISVPPGTSLAGTADQPAFVPPDINEVQ
jgi:NDP-sugar pyrophosphorylase family protein